MQESKFNPDYVVEVKHCKVIADRYKIESIGINEDKEYEMAFQMGISSKKYEQMETKKILVNTYNLGQLVEQKFIHKEENPHTKEIITTNIFFYALYEQQLEFIGRLKSITQEIENKLNMNLIEDRQNEEKMKLFFEERYKVQHEIFLRKLDYAFKKFGITKHDYNDLIRFIKNWIKSCGISEEEINLADAKQHIFPIIQLALKIYSYIETGNPPMEYTIKYKTIGDINNQRLERSFDNLNQLIYYLASGYHAFKRSGYIICEVCGKLAPGQTNKYTCSEKCKKIRNGSYKHI